MPKIGVLAYGSLIDEPGEELNAVTVDRMLGLQTPFPIEYARSSTKRAGAPTLIPWDSGSLVKAQILILQDDIDLQTAKNMVWRREIGRVGQMEYVYDETKNTTSPNKVWVKEEKDIHGVNTVLYTKIGTELKEITPALLAELAIKSVKDAESGKDGISYLMNAIANGIETPLTKEYKSEILERTSTASLEKALEKAKLGL